MRITGWISDVLSSDLIYLKLPSAFVDESNVDSASFKLQMVLRLGGVDLRHLSISVDILTRVIGEVTALSEEVDHVKILNPDPFLKRINLDLEAAVTD